MARSRSLAALACLLTTAIAVAGCGAGGGDGSRITASAVAKTTQKAGTVRVSMRVSFATPPTHSGTPMTITSEGVYDFGNHRGSVRTRTTAGADTFEEETRWIGSRQYMHMSGPASSALEAFTANGAPTKPWVLLPRELVDLADGAGAFAGQSDPAQLLDELRRAASGVRVVGHEHVRDADTVHEQFEIEDKPASGSVTDRVATSTGAFVADVWIDRDGRLRRMRMAPPGGLTARFELELWDYGVNVRVDVPPADQVTDLSEGGGGVVGALDSFTVPGGLSSGRSSLADAQPVELTGPWKSVASGSWRDVTWQVWRAPSGSDVCTSFEPRPLPSPARANPIPPELAKGFPMHDGHPADCGEAADPEEPSLFSLGVDEDTSPKYRVVAGEAAEGTTRVTLTTQGGARIDVPVDPVSHVFVWFGERSVVPTTLEILGTERLTCSLDTSTAIADYDDCDVAANR